MQIQRTKLLSVLSEALDSVEKEIIGTTDHHAKRVAWLCMCMAKELGWSEEEISYLAISALLHDSALIKYRADYSSGGERADGALKGHCVAGEENLCMIPGCETSRGFVLYHHEWADGSGPFGKTEAETPLGAQLIHIADMTDRRIPLGNLTAAELPRLREYIETQRGRLFGGQMCDLLLSVLTEDLLEALSEESIVRAARAFPEIACETDMRALSGLFARIIDYKSPFTKDHSVGLAEKAERMARHYHWDEETVEQMYCAGALHDIGKLLVKKDILEKPGKLDQEEYQHIQSHAYETYRLLSKLEGMGQITEWASFHHEKLNGKGYPFGKTAEQLDEKARLLACLDIYQALTEDRPYKAGMSHQKAASILQELAEKGELDSCIAADIAAVFHREEQEEESGRIALFQCSVCGFLYEGEVIPQGYVCPVCGQPETAFLRIR